MPTQLTVTATRLRLAGVLAASTVLLAACGGSSGTTSASGASPTNAAATTSHGTTVETHSGPLGTYLTDGSGRTLYLFAADHGRTSSCGGGCDVVWPAFTSKGRTTATGQARASMLGTASGGSGQVTYGGHPLYYFAADHAAGDTKGQGLDQFGATWWTVAPNGTALEHASRAGASPTPSSGSSSGSTGGGGGWG